MKSNKTALLSNLCFMCIDDISHTHTKDEDNILCITLTLTTAEEVSVTVVNVSWLNSWP